MSISTLEVQTSDLRGACAHSDAWRELAARVRAFRPDVVFLIARKVPRIYQLLQLDFGDGSLVVSDLALPYVYRFIRSSRVAIVDDVVNVGSTLRHAYGSVVACDAATVRMFALGKRSDDTIIRDHIEYVTESPLSSRQYRRLVEDVPRALSQLARPFDLEFPLLKCRLALPTLDGDRLAMRLRSTFGAQSVHHLPKDLTRTAIERITVDLDGPNGVHGNFKLRIYLNEDEGKCNVTPIAIPFNPKKATLSHEFAKSLLRKLEVAVEGLPNGACLWPDEPLWRAWLYSCSLDFGLAALEQFDGLFHGEREIPLSIEDAELLFGPSVKSMIRSAKMPTHGESVPCPSFSQIKKDQRSPFLEKCSLFASSDIIERVTNAAISRDPQAVFAGIFEVLAASVGASDVSKYALDWPYSKEEIQASPYRRLRIGPTFDDLVSLMERLQQHMPQIDMPIPNLVSSLLDRTIDSGSVVPTTANYDGVLFRIYRKGENSYRDEAADRVSFAWANYGEPLSLTRLAKVNAILSFAEDISDSLTPATLKRGNVGSLTASPLDLEGPEMGEYLRDIGRANEVKKGKGRA